MSSLPAYIDAAKEADLWVALNLIRISELKRDDVVRTAQLAGDCGVGVFYLVDSNGSLFPDDVTEVVSIAVDATPVPLGFHAHDGLSLAFINSLFAVRAGCTYLDASPGGMGKGGGNLSLELVVGYLRSRTQAPLFMAPLARTAATVLKPWKKGVATRCESIASGLLDLNLDSIATLRGCETKELASLVDASPSDRIHVLDPAMSKGDLHVSAQTFSPWADRCRSACWCSGLRCRCVDHAVIGWCAV